MTVDAFRREPERVLPLLVRVARLEARVTDLERGGLQDAAHPVPVPDVAELFRLAWDGNTTTLAAAVAALNASDRHQLMDAAERLYRVAH